MHLEGPTASGFAHLCAGLKGAFRFPSRCRCLTELFLTPTQLLGDAIGVVIAFK